MKVFKVEYKNGYRKCTYIVAARNRYHATAQAYEQEISYLLDGTKIEPHPADFEAEEIAGVYSRTVGIKSKF